VFYVPNDLKLKPLQLSLARPDKQVIANIKHAFGINHIIKFGQINELSFNVPYEIDLHSEFKSNPYISLFRERYLIRVKQNDVIEWYTIAKLSKASEDEDYLKVECYSLPYELRYKRINNYKVTSYNCNQVLTDCLKNTGWKIGYINPEFNLKYRSFDVSSQNKLDFLFEICETFGAVPQFDTINRKINLYKEDELIINKGFKINKYLQSLEEVIDIDEICTQLHVYGKDGISINAVNPTGQSYIEDFSYFLYPFQRDENRNVISHSDWMSDDLCHAILDYNELINANKDTFRELLESKKEYEKNITTKENELTVLNNELIMILDEIEVAKQTDGNLSELNNKKRKKQQEIDALKNQIDRLKKSLNKINTDISKLNEQLKKENNFSPKLLDELYKFTFEDEWTDENYTDEYDLYEAAWGELQKRNTPPINLNINIINFLSIIDEKQNWERLEVGTIVGVYLPKLNINIKTKIIELHFDYENDDINITISNHKRVETEEQKTIRSLYKTIGITKDLNKRKINWEKVAENYNLRNDRNSSPVANPVFKSITHIKNDDGSVNLIVNWDYREKIENIDGFLIYLYSSTINEPYTFGSTISNEAIINITAEKKSYMFPSVPANYYYTVGIQAYRRVDVDIKEDGVIKSEIVSNEIPYLPETQINAKMNIYGKVNGINQFNSNVPPNNPEPNDVWYDIEEKTVKIYNGETQSWEKVTASDAQMLNGKTADDFALVNHTHPYATTTQGGFMSPTDKQKVDNIPANIETTDGSQAKVDAFKTNTAAILTNESWQNASLQNGWVGYSANYTLQYRKNRLGNIEFRGLIKNGVLTDGTIIANLPIGYRPTTPFSPIIYIPATDINNRYIAHAQIVIDTNGDVKLYNAPTGTVQLSFDSIFFSIN